MINFQLVTVLFVFFQIIFILLYYYVNTCVFYTIPGLATFQIILANLRLTEPQEQQSKKFILACKN